MSSYDKLLARLKRLPKDFTMDELRTIMKHNGYQESQRGKTSGSAIKFYRLSDGRTVNFHKPHPEGIVPIYVLKKIIVLIEEDEE